MRLVRVALVSGIALALLAVAALLRPDFFLQAQGPAPYLVLSKEGRQPLAVTVVNNREMVSLDDLSRLFGVTFREDQVARGLVLTVQGKTTITLSSAQGLASIGGRVVSLSSPPVRQGNTWLVPIDVIDRALATVHTPKLDLRPRARLVVVGDLRVPRVTVKMEPQPQQTRLTFDITPGIAHTVVQEPGRLVVRFEADALDLELPAVASGDLLRGVHLLPNAPVIAVDLGPRFNVFRAVDSILDGGAARLTLDLIPQPSLSTAAPGPCPCRGSLGRRDSLASRAPVSRERVSLRPRRCSRRRSRRFAPWCSIRGMAARWKARKGRRARSKRTSR